MSIEINNNTVVRIIVRRGSDSDRQLATLAQGELGYTTDTQRLFIGNGLHGNETVAGNKFLGFTTNINDFTAIALQGDLAYNSAAGELSVFSDGGWSSVAPITGANIEYVGGIRVKSSFAGTGFRLAYGDGKLQFDPNYLSVVTGNSGLYIGSTVGNANSDSILNTQGAISVLGTGSNRLVLSANSDKSTLVLGGSGIVSAAGALDLYAANKTFEIKNGLASGTFAQLTASPSFEFTGGLVKINSSLLVTGSASFQYAATTTTTNVSAVTSFVINTSDSSTSPLTSLLVRDDNAVTGQVLLDVRGTTSGGASRSVLNARIPDGGPFLGIHTTTKYGSNNTSISGSVYFKDGPVNIVGANTTVLAITGNATLQGDLSATGDIIGFYTSDSRLKDNIITIDNALNKTLALRGVTFSWNNSAKYTGNDVGLIAQDVQLQVPEAVGTRYDGYLGVQYEKIIPVLVEAIRELNNKVDELNNKIK